MKRNAQFLPGSTMATVIVLLFVLNAHAQEPFQVKWTMDYTQAGSSNHANFTPSDASLAGGVNTFTLPTVYSAGGAIVVGYIIRPWPVSFSTSRYMEFSFSANSFKYNISSISFRLRKSPNGPSNIKLRTSMDGFASDLDAFVISTNSQFKTYTVPVSFNNLSDNTFTIRIYGYNSVDIYGTLWFDEIIVSGQVLAIILPIDLTYFKGRPEEKHVILSWETAWEKNSSEFVIERSSDGKVFSKIGAVNAAGETTGRTPYEYVDPDPAPGKNYYRLRLVDKDSSFALSKSIAVSMPEKSQGLQVIPNPASPECIIVSTGGAEPGSMTLSTCSGIPLSFHGQVTGSGLVHLYPSRRLNSGLYLLYYQKDGRKEHVKVLVP